MYIYFQTLQNQNKSRKRQGCFSFCEGEKGCLFSHTPERMWGNGTRWLLASLKGQQWKRDQLSQLAENSRRNKPATNKQVSTGTPDMLLE